MSKILDDPKDGICMMMNKTKNAKLTCDFLDEPHRNSFFAQVFNMRRLPCTLTVLTLTHCRLLHASDWITTTLLVYMHRFIICSYLIKLK